MNEVWKDVVGYEGFYEVSDMGNVRDKRCMLLRKATTNKDGYKVVGLTANGNRKLFLLHRLIALAFIDNPENKPQINHKNGVKTDNYLSNLEWVTNRENAIHAIAMGLSNSDNNRGVKNHNNKLNEVDVIDIRNNYLPRVVTQKFFSIKYGITRETVGQIVRREIWKWLV